VSTVGPLNDRDVSSFSKITTSFKNSDNQFLRFDRRLYLYLSGKDYDLVFQKDLDNTLCQTQNYEYFKIFTMFIFILLISFVLFGIAYFLSLSTIKDSEKLSQYECGFEPFDEATRHPFDIHFYVVGILFLIFDVEIALLFPWVLGLQTIGWLGFISMFLFLFILAIGFFYEWHRGALVWPHEEFNREVELEFKLIEKQC
jgi:NADH-quinone oxidoreductase subunit A